MIRKEWKAADVILIQGSKLFHFESVRKFLQIKIYLDTDADLRLSRRSTPLPFKHTPL